MQQLGSVTTLISNHAKLTQQTFSFFPDLPRGPRAFDGTLFSQESAG